MISLLVALVCSLVDPATADLATGIRRLEPTLSLETARTHALAAATAARVVGVEPSLVLAIAHHESHFELGAVGQEVGGRVSCGVMQPTPIAKCTRESLLGSYLTGAEHLHGWIVAAHGELRTALVGYAGGYHLIDFCAHGGEHRGCHVPEVFLSRARIIAARRSS